jgi:hypothetical protein
MLGANTLTIPLGRKHCSLGHKAPRPVQATSQAIIQASGF